MEKLAFGRKVGLNGYTTPSEVRELTEIESVPGLILDLGSGGGWPAKDIAIITRRSVVAMDMVLSGLQTARLEVKDANLEQNFKFVVGDGQHQMFAPKTFGMVLHADALC